MSKEHHHFVSIKIVNWDKYNPKRAQKTYTWLRLDHGIISDKKLYGLDPDQKFAFIAMLCEASKDNKGEFQINLQWLADQTTVKLSKITTMVVFLEQAGIISVGKAIEKPDATIHYTGTTPDYPGTTPTNERTNERTDIIGDERNNSSKLQEASMQGESLEKIQQALEQVFENKVPPDLRRAKPQILLAYGTPENFEACLEDIWNSDNADQTKNKTKWRNYIAVSIKKQIGMIQDAS